jgi:DNA-directed RNA polymerase
MNLTNQITSKLDREAQINSFAPNFIHSLDASVVHVSVQRMNKANIKSLFTIHDCFGCHASRVPAMRKVVAETMRDIFKNPLLKALKTEVASSISLPTNFILEPFYGGFHIDQIIHSPYLIK